MASSIFSKVADFMHATYFFWSIHILKFSMSEVEYVYELFFKDTCYIPFGHVSLDIFRDSSEVAS